MRRFQVSLLATLLLPAVACSATEGAEQEEELACGAETEVQVSDLDAELEGFSGASANDLLVPIEGSYSGTMTWEPNDGPLSSAHAGTSSALTVSLTATGEAPTLTIVEHQGGFPWGLMGGRPCANTVEIPSTVQIETDDGLFAESLDIPLVADDLLYDEVGEPPGIDYPLDFSTHQGSLDPEDFSYDGGEIRGFILTIDWPSEELRGSFEVEVDIEGGVGLGTLGQLAADKDP